MTASTANEVAVLRIKLRIRNNQSVKTASKETVAAMVANELTNLTAHHDVLHRLTVTREKGTP